METLLLDLRYSIRSLLRNPGFTAVAMLTLTLGIGATTAIFSMVNGVLLVPLPYPQPDRLVTVNHLYRARNNLRMPVSPALFRDLTTRTDLFTGDAIERDLTSNLTSPDAEPGRVQVSQVSAGFFAALEVAPVLGRILQADDVEEGDGHVVVVSWGFWLSRFGDNSHLLGRRVTLDNEDYEIVGVMPPSFKDFYWPGTDLFMPLALRPIDYGDDRRGNEYLSFIGRLKPGITIERVQTEMHLMAAHFRAQYPDQYSADWDIGVTTLSDDATRGVRGGLLLLLGAVGFVLLIACANVANLLLARSVSRSRELAIRVVTGASPSRVMRLLLTETVVLAVGAGGLGFLLAVWGVPNLSSWYRGRVATAEVHVDTRVLAFALLVSLLTAVLCGLVPAFRVARTNLNETLKAGGRTTGYRATLGLRRGLVVSTVSLALVLLVGAGLLLRSFAQLVRVDPGFRSDHLLTFDVSLPINGQRRPETFNRIAAALNAIPGVVSAGGTTVLPFSGDSSPKSFPSTRSFNVEGYQPPPASPIPWGEFRMVTSGFLSTLGIPLLAGRQFTEDDRAGAPIVCLVDQELARRYWPNADPIGKRITLGDSTDSSTRWIPVVGVVGHMLQERLDGENRVQVYFHEAQLSTRFLAFTVRTTGSPLAAVQAVRSAVHSVDPQLSLAHMNTMDRLIARSTIDRRFAMLLLCGFAVLAMGLASIGLYGVTSYMATLRSRELGVRLALGADARQVFRLVMSEGLRLALAGLAVGLAAALALTRVMRQMVFDVKVTDPLTFLTIGLLLLGVALVASYLPARRAMRINPIEVLRTE